MKLRRSALACVAASIVLVFAATGRASISGINPGLGDFNDDGWVNRLDIDLLAEKAFEWANDLNPAKDANDSYYGQFNLNGDSDITFAVTLGSSLTANDSDVLIRDILETQYGDANLDGSVAFDDLIQLALHWRQTGPPLGLSNGNFDGSQQNAMSPPRIFIGDMIALTLGWRFTDTSGNVDPADRLFDSLGNRGIQISHHPEPVSWQVWTVGALCAYCLKQRRAKRNTLLAV